MAEVDPNKPAAEIRPLEDYLDREVQSLRLYIFLLGIFGGIAVVLKAIGIYGVMAYSVAERTAASVADFSDVEKGGGRARSDAGHSSLRQSHR